MHARAVTVTGAVIRAATIASEMIILLNIDFRITQVRPRVEKSLHGSVCSRKKRSLQKKYGDGSATVSKNS
jgi:hypothetical protein